MKKLMLALTLVGLMILTGCTSAPKVNTNQRSQMRTKTIEVDYETSYRSLMIVLENEGYTIENTDMQSGLIKASAAEDAFSAAQTFWLGATGTKTSSVSATVSKITKESTRIRINIRVVSETNQGVYKSTGADEIDDPLVYENLFNKLRLEIERMKAIS